MSGFWERNKIGIIFYGGGIFLAAYGLIDLISTSRPDRPYSHPYIQAAPYINPVGCSILDGNDIFKHPQMQVSKSCADQKYLFDEGAYQYGLANKLTKGPKGKGSGVYYRIGDDVFSIKCGNREYCSVNDIEYDVFHR